MPSVSIVFSLLLGLLVAGLAPVPAAAAPPAEPTGLTWLAGDLPPFVWQGPKGPEGFAYDLAQAMAKRLGRAPVVAFYPWARAVRMTLDGDAYGVFPLARTPDREQQFRWLIPLMRVEYSFVVRQTAPEKVAFNPMKLDELRSVRIGVLRGSPIIKNLRAQHFTHIVEAKDYRDLLRMLNEDMLDAVYAGTPMLQASMDQHGYARSAYRLGTHLGEAEVYMATSLKLDPAEAEQWLRAYKQLQDDGTVARLQRQYFR